MHEGAEGFYGRALSAQIVENSCEAGENDGRKNKSPGMRAKIDENLRLDLQANESDDHGHHENAPGAEPRDATGARGDFRFAFVGHPKRAVQSEREISGDANEDCVPIENAGI